VKSLISDILAESLAVKERSIRDRAEALLAAADAASEALAAGRKLLLFGNGGSAADAQHIAAEFVNRFRMDRPPLAALALTTDTSALTAIGNDFGFAEVFSKQVRALGRPGDVALGISTSGNSENVVVALQAAREAELRTIGMTGRGGGRIADLSDILLDVDSNVTARIQETHITMAHVLCELVDRILFGDPIDPDLAADGGMGLAPDRSEAAAAPAKDGETPNGAEAS
jgi:D-sedoheptulose 7-phosphate isomerase